MYKLDDMDGEMGVWKDFAPHKGQRAHPGKSWGGPNVGLSLCPLQAWVPAPSPSPELLSLVAW